MEKIVNLYDMVAKLVLDDSEYEEGMGKAEEKTKSFASKIGGGLVSAGKAVGTAFVGVAGATTAGMVAIAKIGMDYNQEMEDYTTNFATMLGDEEKAIEKVNELKEFASSTPLSMADLAKGTQTLLAFGVANDDTTEKLRQLGDIALGDAEKMQRMATAYGKATAQGKVTGDTVQQMIDAGFNPLLEISNMTGESMESLQDRMSKGTLTVEELDRALEHATSFGAEELKKQLDEGKITLEEYEEKMKTAGEQNGQFAGGMEKASHTTTGLMSTLQDNVKALAGTVSGQLSNAFKNKLLPTALNTVSQMQKAFEKNGTHMFDTLVNIVDGIADFIGNHAEDIMNVFEQLVSKVSMIFYVFGDRVSYIFSQTSDSFKKLGETFNFQGNIIDAIFGAVRDVIVTGAFLIQESINLIINTIIALGEAFMPTIEKISSLFGGFVNDFVDSEDLMEFSFRKIEEGFELVTTAIQIGAGYIGDALDWLVSEAETDGTAINTIITAVQDLFAIVSGVVGEIIDGLIGYVQNFISKNEEGESLLSIYWEGIKSVFNSAVEIISEQIENIVGFIGWLVEEAETDGTAINTAIKSVQSIFESVKSVVVVVINNMIGFIKSFTEENENGETIIDRAWNTIKTTINIVAIVINGILEFLKNGLNNLGITSENLEKLITGVFETIKAVIDTNLTLVNGFLTAIQQLLEGDFSGAFETARDTIGEVVDNIVGFLDEHTGLRKVFNDVVDNVTAMKDNVVEIWEGICDFFDEKVEWLKGLFDFDWSLPDITLPHISVDWTDYGWVSIPSFGIEWYAKAMDVGYMFTSPTVLGGKGFGDAGAEMVIGRDSMMGMISDAQNEGMERVVYKLEQMIEIFAEYFPQFVRTGGFDKEGFVDCIADDMHRKLKALTEMEAW